MSTQIAPWIILFTPLAAAALILLLGRFSKRLSAALALASSLRAGNLAMAETLNKEAKTIVARLMNVFFMV